MTETPQIDLAAETALAGYEIGLIALALGFALAYLFRGMLRRRRGAAPGCNSCPGCSSGGACKVVEYDFVSEEQSKSE